MILLSTYRKPEDWNAMVRKNTTVRDPIGNSSEAIMRRSRLSLRKQIVESDQVLNMNTDNLVEFNPKLSEVAPVTRVAYVKFMKTKLKKDMGKDQEKDETSFENERQGSSKRGSLKKLVEMKDKINVSMGRGFLGGKSPELIELKTLSLSRTSMLMKQRRRNLR